MDTENKNVIILSMNPGDVTATVDKDTHNSTPTLSNYNTKIIY